MDVSHVKEPVNLFDAHCHLQDVRLLPVVNDVLRDSARSHVRFLATNGTSESDWDVVTDVFHEHAGSVIPSYGLHPWYVESRSDQWIQRLQNIFEANPCAAVGEAGLHRNRGKDNVASMEEQLSVMHTQLHLAQRLHRPISLHCVSAFGPLMDSLKRVGSLPHGCLLHSYSGSPDLVLPLARAGAYFSFSAQAVSMARPKLVAVLNQVPPDRLLLESDAPDGFPLKWEGNEAVMSAGPGYGDHGVMGRSNTMMMMSVKDSLRPCMREDVGATEVAAQGWDREGASSKQQKQARPVNHPANVYLACHLVSKCLEQPFEAVANQTFKNAVHFFTFPGSRFEQSH